MTGFTRCLLLLYGLSLAGGAHASRQQDLDNLRERISSMQHSMEKASESKAEAADALRESERAISHSNRKLAELAARQAAANQRLAHLQAQHKKISDSMSGQQALLGRLLNQQYLGGQQEYAKLLLNNQDPSQAARDLQYYRYITRDRAEWLNGLRANLDRLNDVGKSARAQLAEIDALRSEQQSQTLALEKEKRARQHMLDKLAQQIGSQRREISRLQRDENRLAELVEKIGVILARPESASSSRPEATAEHRIAATAFHKLKGRLPFPVRGDVTNRFGARRPDNSSAWKGIFMRAASGQSVKAVAAGRVVFADWLRGFGNLLIVDHGQGYMSLYGNNETLYKQVGDELSGGESIATVGSSGGNEDSGLYFELRLASKPLDPLQWLARK